MSIQIQATVRNAQGTGASRRLRNTGKLKSIIKKCFLRYKKKRFLLKYWN